MRPPLNKRMPYRNVDIHFMSGTGNSFRVARWFAEEAVRRGADTRLAPLNSESLPDSMPGGAQRLLVMTYPTHGFTAPWNVIWFALRLPFGHGAHAAAVATRAGTKFFGIRFPGLDGTAAYVIALIALLKGYVPRGAIGIDMPSNWMAAHPGLKPEKVADIVARAEPKSRRFINRLLDGGLFFGSWVSLPCGIALSPVSLGYVVYGRFWLAKLFFATESCTSCGFCASGCSFGALKMRGNPPRPYWTWVCESCLRCMAFCPKQAVEVSHSFALLIGLLISWLSPLVVIPIMGKGRGIPGLRFLLEWMVFAVILFTLYVLLWRLLKLKAVNRALRATTLTPLFRRYREPSAKVPDMLKPRV